MRDRQPNRLLAWERLQRGWSYEEVADRVRAAMAQRGEIDTGLTANTVRRWETGERTPDPRYRKHLVTIYGKPASELGLLTTEELAMRPDTVGVEDLRWLLDMIVGRSGSESGAFPRSTLLRGLVAAGVVPLLAPLLSLEGATGDARSTDPETYVTITKCHRGMYWTVPARALYEAVYAHTQLGVELLRGASSSIRPRLAAALAESALLTARIAFFDLSSPAVAERCFEVARAATREAGDHALAAAVLGHTAFIPIFGSTPSDARPLIDAALQHIGGRGPGREWRRCSP
jgi:transcriptional regulator with XRE-family HTH domain